MTDPTTHVPPTTDGGGTPARVTIDDINIKFWSLVWLMVKIAFASIPAVIIVVTFTVTLCVFSLSMLMGLKNFATWFRALSAPSTLEVVPEVVPILRQFRGRNKLVSLRQRSCEWVLFLS